MILERLAGKHYHLHRRKKHAGSGTIRSFATRFRVRDHDKKYI